MYSAEISRRSPTGFVILVDQSGSMSQPFGLDATFSKATFVADVVNKWLQNLVLRCAKGDTIRDYFEVAVIGYGERVQFPVGSSGLLEPISKIASSPLRIEDRKRKVDDGVGGIVEMNVKFPMWVEAKAAGQTPMVAALHAAQGSLRDWTAAHPESFPPIVVNITDGQVTDGDPREISSAIKALSTNDGPVLVFNCHISGEGGRPSLYPSGVGDLPDSYADVLFQMSSELPASIAQGATAAGYQVGEGARGFGYQVDAAAFVSFLEIGTRASSLPMVVE